MSRDFKKPEYEVVSFDGNDIVTASGCQCYYPELEDLGSDTTCTGQNVSCTCSPNYDDPSANCT